MNRVSPAEQLNRSCLCKTVDRELLESALRAHRHDTVHADILVARPYLFSGTAVFVTQAQVDRMRDVIAAVEHVAACPQYQNAVLQWAPETARHHSAAHGVFMGFDFHMGDQGPQLIEINTNAGGGFLNAVLRSAQTACCGALKGQTAQWDDAEARFLAMFQEEWRRQGRTSRPLERIAIVDEAPASQYLYPEFELAQRLFRRHGIDAVITDPAELRLENGRLFHQSLPIDLVYNRLTDFALLDTPHASMKAAWLTDAAVFTPHPFAHARYADKRNLALLSDVEQLATWGVDPACIETLRTGVPHTVMVGPDNAEALWQARRSLFFKPAAGYGSKAAYRGDKLTKRVWDDILSADYVAQAKVAPSERSLQVDGQATSLKLDIRAYAYAGEMQLLAARLYQGQTTNFRTPGGGFAAVFIAG